MWRMIRLALPLIFLIFLLFFLWRGIYKDPHHLPSALIGQTVPHFMAPSLRSDRVTLDESLFRGHISVLHVFATWCRVCRSDHPIWVDLAKASRIPIYGLDYKDSAQKARAFLKDYGNPYRRVISDPRGRVAINWGVYGTPETFLIDAKGVVRYKYIGALTRDVWKENFLPRIYQLEFSVRE